MKSKWNRRKIQIEILTDLQRIHSVESNRRMAQRRFMIKTEQSCGRCILKISTMRMIEGSMVKWMVKLKRGEV